MLTGGVVPCLEPWPITEIKLQAKHAGFQLDDFIAYVEKHAGGPKAKLLAQIKHTLTISAKDLIFAEVIQAAWADFKNSQNFDPSTDALAVITGPLSALDTDSVRSILDLARHCSSAKDFFTKMGRGYFTSEAKQRKLRAFRTQLKRANNEVPLSDEELWQFLKRFHLLGYDLDLKSGVTLSLLKSHIGQFSNVDIDALWDKVFGEVVDANQYAGAITRDTLSTALREAFKQRIQHEQPPTPPAPPPAAAIPVTPLTDHEADALKFLVLAGGFSEKSPADIEAIGKLIDQ